MFIFQMSLQKEKENFVKYIKKLSLIAKTFIPDLEPPDITLDSLEVSLQLLKTDILNLRRDVKKHSLQHCCVSILYQLTALILEDKSLSEVFLNSLVYVRPVLYAVNMITPAHGEENLLDAMDHANRARALLKFRKRNRKNNPEKVDTVTEMNFLNRLDQLDRDLQILKDLIMMEITQYSSVLERMRKWHLNDLTIADSSFSSSSSLNMSLEHGDNNNVARKDGDKEKEREDDEDGDLPDLITIDELSGGFHSPN